MSIRPNVWLWFILLSTHTHTQEKRQNNSLDTFPIRMLMTIHFIFPSFHKWLLLFQWLKAF